MPLFPYTIPATESIQTLNLRTNSAAVNVYYNELGKRSQLMLLHEGAVSSAFAVLLRACGNQVSWTLVKEPLRK